MDLTEETHLATQALAGAYERARHTGYEPGSRAMLALQHAEQAHQQARAQDPRRAAARPSLDGDAFAQARRVVDLTATHPTGERPSPDRVDSDGA